MAIDSSPQSNRRPYLAGSATTTLRWGFAGQSAHIVGFLREFSVTEPPPVAEPQVIQPINARRPLEIVAAGAIGHGTITATLYMLYNEAVWARLAGIAASNDLVDISRTLASQGTGLQIVRHVEPIVPNHPSYDESFFNCVVATVGDDQPVAIETMVVEKQLTFWYTHYIKGTGFIGANGQVYSTQ